MQPKKLIKNVLLKADMDSQTAGGPNSFTTYINIPFNPDYVKITNYTFAAGGVLSTDEIVILSSDLVDHSQMLAIPTASSSFNMLSWEYPLQKPIQSQYQFTFHNHDGSASVFLGIFTMNLEFGQY